MRRTHLGLQAAIVLSMVTFVSWPQFRPVRAQSVWRYAPNSVLQARTADAARFAGDPAAGGRSGFGIDNAAFTAADGARNGLMEGTLLGVARTSLNMPIPYARVVLRN